MAEAPTKSGAPAQGGSPKPPPGFEPIPQGKHGGYRKRTSGGGYVYWYPDETAGKRGSAETGTLTGTKKPDDRTLSDALLAGLDEVLPADSKREIVSLRELLSAPPEVAAERDGTETPEQKQDKVNERVSTAADATVEEARGKVEEREQRIREEQALAVLAALEELGDEPLVSDAERKQIRDAVRRRFNKAATFRDLIAKARSTKYIRRWRGKSGKLQYRYPDDHPAAKRVPKTEVDDAEYVAAEVVARFQDYGEIVKREPHPERQDRLTVMSHGLGRDSTAMLCLLAEGKLMVDGKMLSASDVDAVVFSDTGAEWPHTYALEPRVREFCKRMGVRYLTLAKPPAEGETGWKRYNEREKGSRQTPPWKAELEGACIEDKAAGGYYHARSPIREDYARLGKITLRASAGCTSNHKIQAINTRLIADLSKQKFGETNRQRAARVSAGDAPKHEILIGIAADETGRLPQDAGGTKDTPEGKAQSSSYTRPRYPLAEAGIAKGDEQEILERHGFGDVRKSGCTSCHFQPTSWYWALKQTDPQTYREVVDYEQAQLDAARAEGSTPKFLAGGATIPELVETWAARNPDADPHAILDKEYGREKADKTKLETRQLTLASRLAESHARKTAERAASGETTDGDRAAPLHETDAGAWVQQSFAMSFRGVVADLLKARAVKYIRRVPTGNPKRPWRYYYAESASARQVRAGERVSLGDKVVDIDEVRDDGTVVMVDPETDQRVELSPREWSERLHEVYGQAYLRGADRRARQAINAVRLHVPKELLAKLKGKTDDARLRDLKKRVPAVYANLERAFSRAGVDAVNAKSMLVDLLSRDGWSGEGREALLGAVVTDPEVGRKVVRQYQQIRKAAEGLASGGKVEAAHAQKSVDVHTRKGGAPAAINEAERQAQADVAAIKALLGDNKRAEAVRALLESEGMAELQALSRMFPAVAKAPVAQEAAKTTGAVVASANGTRKGAPTTVYVAGSDGQPVALGGHYELAEADAVTPSHVGGSFARSEKYPAGLQERMYHSDKTEQQKVMGNADRLKPEFLLNTNPDALNGPPIAMGDDNIVLGGNSRAMTMQVVYAGGTDRHKERAQQYRDYLQQKAADFGFTPEAVASMKNPVLIRKVDTGDQSPRVLVRAMNESFMGGMDPRTMAVAMGRRLDKGALETLANGIGDDQTLREFLDSNEARPFLAQLEYAGVIDRRNKNTYMTGDKLNEDGKTLVERMLVGRMIGDADLLSASLPSTVSALAQAVPHAIKAQSAGKKYEIASKIRYALDAVNKVRAQGKLPNIKDFKGSKAALLPEALTSARNHLAELALYDDQEHPALTDPMVQRIFDQLATASGSIQLAAAFRNYNAEVQKHPERQNDFLLDTPKEPHQLFAEGMTGILGTLNKKPEPEPEPEPETEQPSLLAQTRKSMFAELIKTARGTARGGKYLSRRPLPGGGYDYDYGDRGKPRAKRETVDMFAERPKRDLDPLGGEERKRAELVLQREGIQLADVRTHTSGVHVDAYSNNIGIVAYRDYGKTGADADAELDRAMRALAAHGFAEVSGYLPADVPARTFGRPVKQARQTTLFTGGEVSSPPARRGPPPSAAPRQQGLFMSIFASHRR